MKYCEVSNVSRIIMLIFLVVFIVICIMGIIGNNKYSCDNGLFLEKTLTQGVNKGCVDSLNKCSSECSRGSNAEECFECMQNNGCDQIQCVEGNGGNIILIVVASLAGLLFLFKLFCMFAPKTSLANAF